MKAADVQVAYACFPFRIPGDSEPVYIYIQPKNTIDVNSSADQLDTSIGFKKTPPTNCQKIWIYAGGNDDVVVRHEHKK